MDVLIGMLLMLIIGVPSYYLKFVDITGFISAMAIGVIIWALGGIGPFLLVLGFFIASGLATKYKYKRKKKSGNAQENKGRRTWRNVLGSGLIPVIIVIFMYFLMEWQAILYMAYASAIATTAADTLASEIGVLSKTRPRMITSLTRRVPRGTPGAVSSLGLKVELLTSFIFGVIAFLFFVPFNLWIIPLVAIVGFLGANIDSLIGAMDKKFDMKVDNYLINFGSSVIGGVLGIMVATGLILVVLGCMVTWVVISGSS